MDSDIGAWVREAQNGSQDALEQVVTFAQGYVYNLALRMLGRPADAEDATQEILIKIVTHLGLYRGESAFTTWMYRVASNTLLNISTRQAERGRVSFEDLSLRLEESLARAEQSAEDAYADAELSEEVRRSCTFAMLMCLDPLDRLTLILGEIVGVTGEEGGAVLEVSPAAYRKRLSRARMALIGFVSARCGVVNAASPCRCHKHVQNKIDYGLMQPDHLIYASQPHTTVSAAQLALAERPDADTQTRAIALLRAHPDYAARLDSYTFLAQLLNPNDPDS